MTQDEAREPVKYTVMEKSLIGNEIFEAGSIALYAGLPAENLEPTCDVGRARYQEYLASNAERVAAMRAQFTDGGVSTSAFADALAKALAEANTNQAALISDAVAAALAKAFPNGTAKPAAKDLAAPPAVVDAPLA